MQIRRDFTHLDELRLLRNYSFGELRQQLDDEIESLRRSRPMHPKEEGEVTSPMLGIPVAADRRRALDQSNRNCLGISAR